MSSQTKIVVLRMKTIIYSIVIAILIIVFLVMGVLMFGKLKDDTNSSTSTTYASSQQTTYTPGRYTTTLTVNANPINLVVTVDKENIKQIEFYHLSDSITASYPLMEPALKQLCKQILDTQSTDNLSYTDNMKYTQQILTQAISSALEKAKTA